MKDTKGQILKTALELFNTLGLSQVSLRTISKKMGISQGNLNYHYKKRHEIIEALYFELVLNIDQDIASADQSENGLEMLFKISKSIMDSFYEYRFFLLDFVQIIRENEKIKQHYSSLTKQRELQFSMFFNLLIAQNIMRPEILPHEYKNLYKRFQILGDFWISSAEIDEENLSGKSVTAYSNLINQSIFPYLTLKGQEIYYQLTTEEK